MTTARTEPTDGFLDREFASFREARLRAKKAKTEDALEHRHTKVAEPEPTAAEPAAAAEPQPLPPPEDAFFGTSTHERTSIRARARDDRATAMLEVMLDDLDGDGDLAATRTGSRIEAPVVAAAPVIPAPAPPSRDDEDGTRTMARAGAVAEDSCSDPEFEAFRAARLGGRPDSGRLRKPEARPESGRMRKPEARRPDGAVEGHCSDPEFERFRAARQAGDAAAPRRADSGRLRKPEPPAPPSAIEQLLSATLPEPTSASPEAETPTETPPQAPTEAPQPVFFGTSVHERAVVRARVLGDSPDPDEPPAAGRRAPPPPLPERPSA